MNKIIKTTSLIILILSLNLSIFGGTFENFCNPNLGEQLINGKCVIVNQTQDEVSDQTPQDNYLTKTPPETPKAIKTKTPPIFPLPKYLFDITFDLNKNTIKGNDKISGIATFTNFGSEITPINYLVILYDDDMNILLKYEDVLIVETQEVRIFDFKEFNNLNLKQGKYSIAFSSIYNTNVKDVFIQDFRVINYHSEIILKITQAFFTFVIALTLFLIVFEEKTPYELKKKSKYKYKIPLFHKYKFKNFKEKRKKKKINK